MIWSVRGMLINMKYNGAIQDLQNNIKSKADGLKNNDWITDATAQYHICMKIDDITAYLALL